MADEPAFTINVFTTKVSGLRPFWKMAAWVHVWPAWEVEQFVLVGDRGLVLQLPHQCADEVRVLDDNWHLLEHMLKANVSLLQPGEWDRTGGTEAGEERFSYNLPLKWGHGHVIEDCDVCAISNKIFNHYLFAFNVFTDSFRLQTS